MKKLRRLWLLLAALVLAPLPATFAATNRPERPDFQDAAGATDYAYDAAGSLTRDANKRLTSISYNHLRLPERLVFAAAAPGASDSLRFVYAANGQKVAKYAYASGRPPVRTDYLGPWQYAADTLRWLTTAAGRALRTVNRTSGAVAYAYEYSIKDHLGNLRLAFRRGEPRRWTASLEPDAAAWETKDFDAASVSAPIADNQRAASGNWSALLCAAPTSVGGGLPELPPQPIGPTKLWAVQGGDTVRAAALAHCLQPAGRTWRFALPTFLAGYLSQPPPGAPDGAGTARSFAWLQVGLAANLAAWPSFANGVPRAYLRLLAYRADSTVLLDRIAPLTSAALYGWEPVALPPLVLPLGAAYAQVYVANEGNVPVWFDEVSIEHRPGLQVQENHYDPFGLDLAGLSRSAPGLRALNQYQWNGKEKQADFGLGWTALDWRNYDPAIGRMVGVDPLAEAGQESWNTYHFGYDNPVRFNDPDGRCPECKVLWASGGMYGNASNDDAQLKQMSADIAKDVVKTLAVQAAFLIGGEVAGIALGALFRGGAAAAEGAAVAERAAVAGGRAGAEAAPQFTATASRAVARPAAAVQEGKAAAKGLGNPFKGKSLPEVQAGFERQVQAGKLSPRYTSPVSGSKSYANTKSGYSYNVDTGLSGRTGVRVEPPHVDVNHSKPNPDKLPKKKLFLN